MSWRDVAQRAQTKLIESIPQQWRLDVEKYTHLKDVTDVPRTCGLLTENQLKITNLTVVEIVAYLERRELRAVDVLEAFAARTAIAHQLVGDS